MVDPFSTYLLNTGVQKGLMTPKVASSGSILQLVATDTMRGDLGELDNQPKGYHEFVSDSKLCHTIIAKHALDPWFSNMHNLKHLILMNHIWWHDKAIVVLDVSLQRLNIKCFLLQEHHDVMYSGHIEVIETSKRM